MKRSALGGHCSLASTPSHGPHRAGPTSAATITILYPHHTIARPTPGLLCCTAREEKLARAEFSERHYELAVNLEMLRHSDEYFVPSQPEEKTLGYDIAVVPTLPGVWSRLAAGLPGVGLGEPKLAPATSLFIQYKRPDFISNRKGKQSPRREEEFHRHDPYYRIKLEKEQLEVLLDLQDRFSGRASVCYTAGCFHTRTAFYSYKLAGSVADNSIFLPLNRVKGALVAMGLHLPKVAKDHFWTYDPNGHQGLLCSEACPLEGLHWKDLQQTLRQVPEAEPLEQHVEAAVGALLDWRRDSVEPRRSRLSTPSEEWTAPTPRRVLHPPTTPLIEAHEELDRLGIGWFLAVRARRRES